MKILKYFLVSVSMFATTSTAFAIGLYGEVNTNAEVNTQGTVQTNTSVNVDSKTSVGDKVKTTATEKRIEVGKNRADQEIDRRIKALSNLETNINSMDRVSVEEKASLSSSIQGQIDTLTNLKAKISSDSDLTTLKTDIKSITASYRIFALIIPQGHIAATVDKIRSTIDMMIALQAKLQSRIDAAKSAGSDTVAMATLISDMNAKLANAKTEADVAASLSAGLKPDNGDQAIFKSNNEALKSARAKIKSARADLRLAREDAQKIRIELHKIEVKMNYSATGTTTVQ